MGTSCCRYVRKNNNLFVFSTCTAALLHAEKEHYRCDVCFVLMEKYRGGGVAALFCGSRESI